MPLLSTKGRYAVRIMAALANHGDERPLRTGEIARNEDLSGTYTAQLLSKLKSAGLVHSVRGRNGGFVLSCNPQSTDLLTVLQAVEEDVCVTPCAQQNSAAPCPRDTTCPARALWARADEALHRVLGGTTLAALACCGAAETAPTYDI